MITHRHNKKTIKKMYKRCVLVINEIRNDCWKWISIYFTISFVTPNNRRKKGGQNQNKNFVREGAKKNG